MRVLICLIAALVSSCSIYKSSFDCPPNEGLGCTPVTEVLDLIVENETGEDLFIKDPEKLSYLKRQNERRNHNLEKKLYLLKEHDGMAILIESEEILP